MAEEKIYCGSCHREVKTDASGKILTHFNPAGGYCSNSNSTFTYGQKGKKERDEALLDLHRSMRR